MRRGVGLGVLVVSLSAGGIAAACGSSGSSSSGGGGPKGDGGLFPGFDGSIFDPDAAAIVVSPTKVDITLNPGGPPPEPFRPTVTGSRSDQARFRLTNPSLGGLDAATGVFTPSGRAAGQGEIQVLLDGEVVGTVHVTVTIAHEQTGGPQTAAGDAGAGGLGGVGGEGFGGAPSDEILAILKGTPAADAALTLLYPYDRTVFPLGILPPLLQWTDGGNGPADGVYVHLSAPPFYDYRGYFARPAALAGGAAFVRHPIPREVWDAATNSAAGATLHLEVVVAAGGKAYGPMKEDWDIALAPFNGRIYYQAYATAFVQNWSPEVTVWGDRFGGATLSIEVGAEAPKLVAGTTTDDHTGCRVCHSVSAYGDRMIVQHGEPYSATSSYDLKNGNTESSPYADGTVGWAGLSPDGALGLANSMDVTGSNSNDGDTALYDMATGAVVPSPGLAEFATRIGLPAFSPDYRHVAFSLFRGASTPAVGNANGRKLVAMGFDPATRTFSNPELLWEAPADDQRPSFVTFMPGSDAVVFQRRWKGSNDDVFSTWYGSRGELWWVDLATRTATPLDRVNGIGADGKSYLPRGPRNHDADERLNYEPSISPVASGGYAWMVFMSRRQYGNIATRDPWESDPRDVDIHGDDPTTKKLWMAAIDLNPKPGTDPSHPAFYIPGQEIKGVNSRPFFALQPCVTDRGTCTTGVDCCSGFCRDGLCGQRPTNECSRIDERCTESTDCCDARAQCIGGFCAAFLQ